MYMERVREHAAGMFSLGRDGDSAERGGIFTKHDQDVHVKEHGQGCNELTGHTGNKYRGFTANLEGKKALGRPERRWEEHIKRQGISEYQQLKKKSAATALNTVLASAHIQRT
jgi:hypothetical protein